MHGEARGRPASIYDGEIRRRLRLAARGSGVAACSPLAGEGRPIGRRRAAGARRRDLDQLPKR